METKSNLREIILDILNDIEKDNFYSNQVILKALKKYQYLDKQNRSFIMRISEGTIEYRILLDYIIDKFSSVKTKKLKPTIRNILRMSVYQLKFMDSIRDSAVCNEAVILAKKKGFKNLAGFVNGVIRNIARNLDNIEYPNEDIEREKYLSVMTSTPEWIIKKFLSMYDYNTVKDILFKSLEDNKKTSIRVNISKVSVNELIEELEKIGVDVEKGNFFETSLKISGYDYLNKLEAFKKGYFQVQDESSMLPAIIANPKISDTVLDVCSAPGGKAIHMADLTQNQGVIISRDISQAKTDLIRENIERNGFKNIIVEELDATILDENLIEKMDIVMADVPCSGLGVFAKKSDIKYKMTEDIQKELVKLQRKILSTVNNYVKKDGILIYSTCTINNEENIDNVNWFIENYPFELESFDEFIPNNLRSETTKKGYLQLLPNIHSTDGFFVAKLRRKS